MSNFIIYKICNYLETENCVFRKIWIQICLSFLNCLVIVFCFKLNKRKFSTYVAISRGIRFYFTDYYKQYNIYYKRSSVVKIVPKKVFEQINAIEH